MTPETKLNQTETRPLKTFPGWGWAILVLLVIGGGLYWLGRNKISIPPERAPQVQTAAIVEQNDLEGCEVVKGVVDGVDYRTVCRNNIFLKRAKVALDFSACEGLDDKLLSVADCEDQVMQLALQKEKNVAVCAKVPERLKPSCPGTYLRIIAAAERNPRLCEKASSSAENVACQYFVLTGLLARGEKPNCVSFNEKTVAAACKNYDAGRCSQLTEPTLMTLCSGRGPER